MFYQVRPSQLDAWLEQLPPGLGQPLMLDVREPWECQQASLSAQDPRFALHLIPMQELPARLPELDSQRPTICLCHHGVRSMRVAAYLAQQGFAQVANLTGGIDAWSCECDHGLPRY